MINAFASKYGRVGAGLAGIIVMDPEVKFYQSGSKLTSMLEGFGFTNSGETAQAMTEVDDTQVPDVEVPAAGVVNTPDVTPAPPQADPSAVTNPWDTAVDAKNPFNA